MPHVHHVKKAQKDHPGGIKKGESYYWWKFRHGGRHVSKTAPRESQLTSSEKLARFYAAQESVSDASERASGPEDLDMLRDAVESAVGELNEVAEEYRESAESIRESFSESPTADDCDEKAEAIEDIVQALEEIDWDLDAEPDQDEDPDAYEAWAESADLVFDAVNDVAWDMY